jgi:hypothetical protein
MSTPAETIACKHEPVVLALLAKVVGQWFHQPYGYHTMIEWIPGLQTLPETLELAWEDRLAYSSRK